MVELTPMEKASSTWCTITSYLEAQITSTQRRLEGPLNGEQTSELRGRIRAFRSLLSLGDEHPMMLE